MNFSNSSKLLSRNFIGSVGLSAIAFFGVPESAGAASMTSTSMLPPDCGLKLSPECGYRSAQDLHAIFEVMPELEISFNSLTHTGWENITKNSEGMDEMETFDSILWGFAEINGQVQEFDLEGTVNTTVFGKVGNDTGTFDTEINFLHEGQIMGMNIMIRTSQENPSIGETTITSKDPTNPDEGFTIDSFFDVNTEISLDGGDTWTSANETVRVNLEDIEFNKIPEPSMVLASIFGLGGMLGLKRKKESDS